MSSDYDCRGNPSEEVTVQVSSKFHPNSALDPVVADTLIFTADNVFFAVHSHRLMSASSNYFGDLLRSDIETQAQILPLLCVVLDSSDILNVVMCTVYGLSCDLYAPSSECIEAITESMKKYGMALQ